MEAVLMSTATSQNGWPALEQDSPRLYTWVIPARTGHFKLRMRNGSAGFLLALWALWYAEVIEPVAGKVLDDWGFSYRLIRGDTTSLSNHASGTAEDLNATKHPLAKVRTGVFAKQSIVDELHARLRFMHGVIRWGGDYHNRKDEMHFEIVQNITYCEIEAKRLLKTWRGRRLIKANPSQRTVIYN
jgi:hypothetical protein